MNCPRCGFQQPSDKYCAQCGVDMETFRPATPPLWKRVVGHVGLQVSALVLVAIGASVFIYQQGQQNLESRVTYLKSTVQIKAGAPAEPVDSAETMDPATPDPMDSAVSEQASQSPAVEAAATTASASPNGVSNKEASSSDSATTRRDVARSSAHLVVYYAEVDRGTLAGLVSSSRTTGQFMSFDDYSAGILPNLRAVLPRVKVLHKEDRPVVREAKTLQWFLGLTDPRDPTRQIGFNTYLEINDSDARNLRGNIEILRLWREENAPGSFETQRKTFPAIFEIGSGVGFFMYGMMPRQSHLTDETDLLKIDLYKILTSPAFRANESEFVIFVDYDRNN